MPKKVLVIDDDPDVTSLLEQRLQSDGFSTLIASDGSSGLKKAQEESPDLIILDMMMPDIQGSTLCASLKADPKFQFIPIIMLTARDNDHDKEVVLASKADAYITKPFESKELMAKVRELSIG